MTGKYEIRIENRSLVYEFTIRRNITVIRGNSATGKTTLISSNAECISAGGKTRIYRLLLENKDRCCLIIADGAAFGSEMEKIYD